MRRKLSATSLTVATSAVTLETLRKYNKIHSRSQKMPDTYSLPKKAEHPRSDFKIDAMLTYGTDSATSTYNQI
jgi:hypothetical protein